MKLAVWQKRMIEPEIHGFANIEHNDLNRIYGAIERACSGGMHTNGPDDIARSIRKELEFLNLKHGNPLTLEQRLEIERAMRSLIKDLMP